MVRPVELSEQSLSNTLTGGLATGVGKQPRAEAVIPQTGCVSAKIEHPIIDTCPRLRVIYPRFVIGIFNV